MDYDTVTQIHNLNYYECNDVEYRILKTQLNCFPCFTCPHFQFKLIVMTLDQIRLSCARPDLRLEL